MNTKEIRLSNLYSEEIFTQSPISLFFLHFSTYLMLIVDWWHKRVMWLDHELFAPCKLHGKLKMTVFLRDFCWTAVVEWISTDVNYQRWQPKRRYYRCFRQWKRPKSEHRWICIGSHCQSNSNPNWFRTVLKYHHLFACGEKNLHWFCELSFSIQYSTWRFPIEINWFQLKPIGITRKVVLYLKKITTYQ